MTKKELRKLLKITFEAWEKSTNSLNKSMKFKPEKHGILQSDQYQILSEIAKLKK